MRKMLKKLGVVIPSVVLTLLMAVGFSTPASCMAIIRCWRIVWVRARPSR